MRYFGTDGIRRKNDFFDEAFLTLFSYGLATQPECKRVALARDTRPSGEYIVEQVKSSLLSRGVDVVDLSIVPSPCLALCVEKLECDYGVMVTASHNPPVYNGLKLFDRDGSKVSSSIEKRIEDYMGNPFYLPEKKGSCFFENGEKIYLSHAEKTFPDIHNKKILIDCAYGAASGFAARVFRALGAEPVAVCNESRGEKINVFCGATNPKNLLVHWDGSFDAAVSCDGDADRIVCYKNKFFDGDALVFLSAENFSEQSVCGTVTTNSAYEKTYKEKNIKFYRSDVGDRNVYRLMKKTSSHIGGETSGHVIFDKVLKTGDGLLSAAIFASLSDKAEDFSIPMCPTVERTIPLTESEAFSMRSKCGKSVYFTEDGVYCLLRVSGTEPLLRVKTESEDRALAENKMKYLLKHAREVLVDRQFD